MAALMPLGRIGPLWALLIAFVVLMASNAWLKGIFGYGEIATDVPFLLTGLTLFGIWKFNRRAGTRNTLMGSARFGDRRDLAKLEGSGGIVFVNRDGLRWRDAPKDYGAHKTLYSRWKRWTEMGVFVRMIEGLAATDVEPRTPVRYGKRRYRRISRIEIMLGRLKDWHLVATRYDRCPTAFFSAVALAATVTFSL